MADAQITELWEAVNGLREGQAQNKEILVRIETKLDERIGRLDERNGTRISQLGDLKSEQEKIVIRVGELEKRERHAAGKAAGIALVLSAAAAFISRLFK